MLPPSNFRVSFYFLCDFAGAYENQPAIHKANSAKANKNMVGAVRTLENAKYVTAQRHETAFSRTIPPKSVVVAWDKNDYTTDKETTETETEDAKPPAVYDEIKDVEDDGTYAELEYYTETTVKKSCWSKKRMIILVLILLFLFAGITCAVVFPMGLVLKSGGNNPLAETTTTSSTTTSTSTSSSTTTSTSTSSSTTTSTSTSSHTISTTNSTRALFSNDGLVSLWSFADGSGTIAHDSVGVNSLNFSNSPIWVTSSYGKRVNTSVIYISLSSQRASFILPSNILTANSITVTTWVYFMGLGSNPAFISLGPPCPSSSDCTGARGFGLAYYNYNVNGGYRIETGPTCINSFVFTNNCTAYQWYHLAVTKQGSLWVLYLNGIPVQGVNIAGMNALNNGDMFCVGKDGCASGCNTVHAFAGAGYGGYIGETRLYNRTLSQEDVQSIFLLN